MNRKTRAAVAVTRFGLGAKIGEIADVRSSPRGYLLDQLRRPRRALIKDGSLLSSETALKNYYDARRPAKMMSKAMEQEAAAMRKKTNKEAADHFRADIAARTRRAMETDHSFLERWVRFWSNHFTVSARKTRLYGLVGAFEREAIRPNVLGSFTNLALASSFHVTMLIYLDNYRSIGPRSRFGRKRARGLNENLAREILELHTLGVGAYSQDDVKSFAHALTGWTIGQSPNKEGYGLTVFKENWHEPGAKTFRGYSVPDIGPEQAGVIIQHISAQPETARHIAAKLVRHFVSDTPHPNDIDALAQVFMETNGNLKSLAKAVVRLDSAWEGYQNKYKSPDDWVVSAGRIFGFDKTLGKGSNFMLMVLGQPVFQALGPDGYSDISSDWIGADALKKRLEWANKVAHMNKTRIEPSAFLKDALGALQSPNTQNSVGRAGSRAQGLTLALMSPEFQRR